jgi:hypothetical protein
VFLNDEDLDNAFFGTGYSGGEVSGIETDIFTHVLSPSHHGVMNHFWLTGMENVMALTRVNYYIDGIVFYAVRV